jgi:hypothetical protein
MALRSVAVANTGRKLTVHRASSTARATQLWYAKRVLSMGRRGRKRQLNVESRYWQLLLSGVGTVEACRAVGITRKTGTAGAPKSVARRRSC